MMGGMNRFKRTSGFSLGMLFLAAWTSVTASAQTERNSLYIDQNSAGTGGEYTLTQRGSGNSIGADEDDRFVVSGDGQTVDIVQIGEASSVTGALIGDNITYLIVTDGSNNSVDLGQSTESGFRIDGSNIDLFIQGENNLATLGQASEDFSDNATVDIDIIGSDNTYDGTIDSGDIFVSQRIEGNFNLISSTQAVSSGQSSTLQISGGDENEFILEQTSFLSSSDDTTIIGSSNVVDVRQTENGGSNTLVIAGSGNQAIVKQESTTLSSTTAQTSITGASNQLSIQQTGSDMASDETSINGNGNNVSIIQAASGGANTLGIDGDANTVNVEQASLTASTATAATSIIGSGNQLSILQQAHGTASDNTTINGDGNTINTAQSEDGATNTLAINGSGNEIDVTMGSDGVSNFVDTDIEGNGNDVDVSQFAKFDAASSLTIIGETNAFSVDQSGPANGSIATISGGENSVDLVQAGSGEIATSNLEISGSFNDVTMTQNLTTFDGVADSALILNGDTNIVALTQSGAGPYSSDINVSGSVNNIILSQTGSIGSQSNISIAGSNNDVNVGQSGPVFSTANISIEGENNSLTVAQEDSMSAFVDVMITGNDSIMNITQSTNLPAFVSE